MKPKRSLILAFLVAASVGASAGAESPVAEFSGHDSGKTDPFDVKGPWLLDWRIDSEFPDLATTKIQLVDASDQLVGVVANFRGTGNGLKLFRETGTFRLDVTAENSRWFAQVTEISETAAARLEQMTRATRDDRWRSSTSQNQVATNSFSGWHLDGDHALILVGTGETNFRVSFGSNGCPGLAAAKTISFVTPDAGPLDVYDSVLLDDGTRCRFSKVTWVPQ